jgi:hypothetical protein
MKAHVFFNKMALFSLLFLHSLVLFSMEDAPSSVPSNNGEAYVVDQPYDMQPYIAAIEQSEQENKSIEETNTMQLLQSSGSLSLEDKLKESRIITPIPTKSGLPTSWKLSSIPYRDRFLEAVKSKTFDLDNVDYFAELNTSIREFVAYNEPEKLMEIIKHLREKYCGKIKPEDIPTGQAHKYLTTLHKNKLDTLKQKSIELDKDRLAKLNSLVTIMKKEYITHLNKAQDEVSEYQTAVKEIIEKSGIDIRKNKEALLRLHLLNGTFQLDGYCSDYETDDKNSDHKKVKNPDYIAYFYSNEHILEKTGMDIHNKNAHHNIRSRFVDFDKFYTQTHNLPTLTYHDNDNGL